MDREYRLRIRGRLSLLVGNVENFDKLLEEAVKSKLIDRGTINEWESLNYTEEEQIEKFFIHLTSGGPGTIGKLTGPLLRSNNHDILDILHDDYVDPERWGPSPMPPQFDDGPGDGKPFEEKYMLDLEYFCQVEVKPAIDFYGGKKFNKHDFYTMESKPRGFALVIVNEVFHDSRRNRYGAARDFDLMQQLLRKLHYDVFPQLNKTKKEIEGIVDEFTQQPKLKSANSCIVAISSHGVKDGFCGTDGGVYAIETLKEKFNNVNCQALKGKAKFFIIQACRGSLRDTGAAVDRHDDDGPNYGPKISDMFIEYSCQPGYLSNRNEVYGSWLFYMVVKVFKENAWQDDLTELIRKVHAEIAQLKSTNQGQKQAAEWCVNGLWKQLYFNPGLELGN